MSEPIVITCTRCDWTRITTPTAPQNPRKDLAQAVRARDRLGVCPRCRDVNLIVEKRDCFGRTILRELA